MKKTALIFAALIVVATGAVADEATKTKELTIAAADVSNKTAWIETNEDVQRHLQEDVAAKTKELADAVNAGLEQKLAAKLAQDFGL